jgi:septal ring factor EnvC (AmiA/AmiB activator)
VKAQLKSAGRNIRALLCTIDRQRRAIDNLSARLDAHLREQAGLSAKIHAQAQTIEALHRQIRQAGLAFVALEQNNKDLRSKLYASRTP